MTVRCGTPPDASSVLEPVAREQVIAAAAEREQRRRNAGLRQQHDALDEARPVPRLEPARDDGREGEKELVDEAAGDERAERQRPGLHEHELMAARAQDVER